MVTKKKETKEEILTKLKATLNRMGSPEDIIWHMRQYAPDNSSEYVKERILNYEDLVPFYTGANTDILNVIPEEFDYRFIFIKWTETGNVSTGHWCLLSRYLNDAHDPIIEWFDPLYSNRATMKPDGELDQLTEKEQEWLGQDKHVLSEMLMNAPRKFIITYNDQPLQDPATCTCYRWCIARAMTIVVKHYMDLDRFCDTIFRLTESEKFVSPDVAITELVPFPETY